MDIAKLINDEKTQNDSNIENIKNDDINPKPNNDTLYQKDGIVKQIRHKNQFKY